MNIEDLKKEIPYKWRVQSSNQYGAKCVAYVDSRDIQKLFDEVCGQFGWGTKFYELKGNLFCSIGVRDDNYGDWDFVWKSDCGTESNVEKKKGEASDAFKRAAIMWGAGRFLYDLPIITLQVKESNGKYIPYSDKSGKFIRSSELITKWCDQLLKK